MYVQYKLGQKSIIQATFENIKHVLYFMQCNIFQTALFLSCSTIWKWQHLFSIVQVCTHIKMFSSAEALGYYCLFAFKHIQRMMTLQKHTKVEPQQHPKGAIVAFIHTEWVKEEPYVKTESSSTKQRISNIIHHPLSSLPQQTMSLTSQHKNVKLYFLHTVKVLFW